MKSRSPRAADEGKNPHAKTETDPRLAVVGHSLEGFRGFFCRVLRNGSTSGHSARKKKFPTHTGRFAPGVATLSTRARFTGREGVFRDSFREIGRAIAGARVAARDFGNRNSGAPRLRAGQVARDVPGSRARNIPN